MNEHASPVAAETRQLIVIGAGEHALVVGEAAALAGWTVLGYVAPAPAADIGILGSDDDIEKLRAYHPGARWIIGIGRLATRRRAIDRLALPWATIIHPTAFVSPTARVDSGTWIGPRVSVHRAAIVSAHAILNSGSIIEHDAVIGENAHVAPGGTLGGGAVIGPDAMVGLGAVVRDHAVVGAGSVVAMGAVVVGDIAPGLTVFGCPARAKRA